MVNIKVNPPQQVQAGAIMYPPLVLMSRVNQYTFYQVSLVDHHGRALVANHDLRGTLAASPQALEGDAAGRSSPRDFAVFPNLSITEPGRYRIQVNAYYIDYETMPPTTLLTGSTTTGEILVRNSAVPRGRPSFVETQTLASLAAGGFPIP
ncbi:hypothetical protein F5Y14DRAFT_14887 [Nemania sp. NC0429]|nr:hypothetical protein F5Y14DRAFT_14887 [Nemania sp. NC0429]